LQFTKKKEGKPGTYNWTSSEKKERLIFTRYLMKKNLASQVVRDGQIAVGAALMKGVTLKCGEKLWSPKKNKSFTY
jgi:hypothetical protein